MADFDEMKKAMNSANIDDKILLDQQVAKRLINEWGPELILECICNRWPSHSLWGQKGYGKCGSCNVLCKPVFVSWSTSIE